MTRRSPARSSGGAILMALLSLGLPCTVQAQVPLNAEQLQQLRQIEQQLRDRAPGPQQRAPSLDLRILTPEKAAVPRAVDELEFEVKQVEITGATFFPKTEVDAFFTPLLQKKIGLSASKRTPLFNGALECRLFEYKVVAGFNRKAKPGE